MKTALKPLRWERVSWKAAVNELCLSRDTIKREARRELERRGVPAQDREEALRAGVAFMAGGRWVRMKRAGFRHAIQFEEGWRK